MTYSLIGANMNAAEAPENVLLDFARRSKAKSHTVMHGMMLARKVYDIAGQVTGEEPVIVCREDWPDQNWLDPKYSNLEAYVAGWKNRGGWWPGAYLYFLNEPVVGNDVKKLRSLLDKCIQFMELCAKHKVKGVVGNFADASTFERHWLEAGEFDRFLQVAGEWTNDGHGFIGHHNYTWGALWVGAAGFNHWNLGNPALMGFDAAPTREDVQSRRVWENWLQMRFMWPLLRADQKGYKRYRFVITEGLWDRMPNGEIEGWIPKAEQMLVGGRKLRGPLDQQEIWAKWWGLNGADAAIRQMKWWVSVMQGLPCVGAHLFTLSYNHEWTTFNFINMPGFFEAIDDFARETAINPPKENPPVAINTTPIPADSHAGWRDGRLTVDRTNLREHGDINARVIRNVTGTFNVRFQTTKDKGGVRNTAPEAPGAEWIPLKFSDGAKGWMRSDVIKLVELKPVAKTIRVTNKPPFVSQFGPGADLTKNDCGLAAVASVLHWLAGETNRPSLRDVTPDSLAKAINKGYLNTTTINDLYNAARYYAVDLIRYSGSNGMTPARIRKIIEEQKAPAIVLCDYSKFPAPKVLMPPNDNFSHYVVVHALELDADDNVINYVVDDNLGKAGQLGENFRVPADMFEESIRVTPGNSIMYQGLALHPDELIPNEPEVDPNVKAEITAIRSDLVQISTQLVSISENLQQAIARLNLLEQSL